MARNGKAEWLDVTKGESMANSSNPSLLVFKFKLLAVFVFEYRVHVYGRNALQGVGSRRGRGPLPAGFVASRTNPAGEAFQLRAEQHDIVKSLKLVVHCDC